MIGFEKVTNSHMNVKNGMGLQFSRQWKSPSNCEANNFKSNIYSDPLLTPCYVKLERLSDEYIKAMTERYDDESDLLRLVRVSPEPTIPTLGKAQNTKRAGVIMKCARCPFRTKNKTNFLLHIKRINYSCPLCPFKANLKCAIFEHHHSSTLKLQKENGLQMPTYFCDFCRYFCKDGEQLLSHLKTHKTTIFSSTYSCSYCDFKACSKSKLKDHYVYSHKMLFSNIRFACDKINRSSSDVDPDILHKIKDEASMEDQQEIIRIKFTDSLVVLRINRIFVVNQQTGPTGKTEIIMDVRQKQLDENQALECDIIKETSYLINSMPEAPRVPQIDTDVSRVTQPPSGSDRTTLPIKGEDNLSQENWYQCKYHCSFKTPSNETFLNHTKPVYFKCPKCLFSTKIRCDVSRHMKSHLEKDLKCELCKYQAHTTTALKEHVALHDSNLETPVFMCGLCDYLCMEKETLLEHSGNAHLSSVATDRIFCGYCKYETSSEDSLTDHYVEVHNFVQQLMLKRRLAEMQYLRDAKKKRNIAKRGGNVAEIKKEATRVILKRTRYKCEHCDYATIDRLRFNKHNFKHHKKVLAKVYKCSKCPYDTVNHISMRRHYTFKHKTKRGGSGETLECDICGFTCKDAALMEVHSSKHKNVDEVKIYSCDRCSFETIFKNHMQKHKKVHDGSTPDGEENVLKCLKCNFRTERQFELIAHNFTHILEKCSNKANKGA
ncbi:zinc finger protein 142-like [Cylas formicarius]|uniref:zinc finger protein 142-like n=1 Tax=Cylas formicarius TaxID=197179 RepID=UPI002958BB90|nr:zinc finger protein 142-like [Cylas formicarius]XP_060528555.1 zinc finger protein 142-like [Cylas formicarius]XP_060528556.1 zinc finger protein 142-like [Cylas formicarius]